MDGAGQVPHTIVRTVFIEDPALDVAPDRLADDLRPSNTRRFRQPVQTPVEIFRQPNRELPL
jgi:hypothetical protein